MLGTRTVLRFILQQAREAFAEREFIQKIGAAIARELKDSPTLNAAVDRVNDVTTMVLEKYRGLGPTGYFLKAAIASHLKDLAQDDAEIAAAMNFGAPYLQAVLDGITVEEALSATRPLGTLVAEQAKAAISRMANQA
jgi:hypothetical protein